MEQDLKPSIKICPCLPELKSRQPCGVPVIQFQEQSSAQTSVLNVMSSFGAKRPSGVASDGQKQTAWWLRLCTGCWDLWGQSTSLNLPLSCGSGHVQEVCRLKSLCGDEVGSEGLKGFFQVGSRDDSFFLMHSGVMTGKGPTPGGLTSTCLPAPSG